MSGENRPIIVVGEPLPSGAYLLRIRLRSACDVCFGRFNGGRAIHLPADEYVYVGSAMGKRGSATLANRLLRHARRTGDANPHPIYADLETHFMALGWLKDRGTPRRKHHRWHIDYLLDHPESELIQVFIFCSQARIEGQLAEQLAAAHATCIVAPGLGASDSPGNTHLLRVNADGSWWRSMKNAILVNLGKDSYCPNTRIVRSSLEDVPE